MIAPTWSAAQNVVIDTKTFLHVQLISISISTEDVLA